MRFVQFRVLGPVEVHAGDGRVLTLARRQERCLLAILALNAGRPVSVDRLCDLLWEDGLPARPQQAIRSYVSRIRAMLAGAGGDGTAAELVAHGGGYLLKVAPDAVDAHRFRRLVAQAAQTADPLERDGLLHDALALWRGPPLDRAARRGGSHRGRHCPRPAPGAAARTRPPGRRRAGPGTAGAVPHAGPVPQRPHRRSP